MNIQFTASIVNNSNKIISSSEDKFGGIGNGNLIRIGDHTDLYTVIGREEFSYVKSFSTQSLRSILIDEDVEINL